MHLFPRQRRARRTPTTASPPTARTLTPSPLANPDPQVDKMDVEKLKKLAGSVRMGGKGTMRRCVHSEPSARADSGRFSRDGGVSSAGFGGGARGSNAATRRRRAPRAPSTSRASRATLRNARVASRPPASGWRASAPKKTHQPPARPAGTRRETRSMAFFLFPRSRARPSRSSLAGSTRRSTRPPPPTTSAFRTP